MEMGRLVRSQCSGTGTLSTLVGTHPMMTLTPAHQTQAFSPNHGMSHRTASLQSVALVLCCLWCAWKSSDESERSTTDSSSHNSSVSLHAEFLSPVAKVCLAQLCLPTKISDTLHYSSWLAASFTWQLSLWHISLCCWRCISTDISSSASSSAPSLANSFVTGRQSRFQQAVVATAKSKESARSQRASKS